MKDSFMSIVITVIAFTEIEEKAKISKYQIFYCKLNLQNLILCETHFI